MRMRLVATFALALGLAAGLSARADDKESKSGASATQTIRGTVAGVTLEGEVAIDYKTNRAVESDMTMLTIVGSPVRSESNAQGEKPHRRHNVYVIWLAQGTKVKDASGRPPADKGSQAEPWTAIELGDHVEVDFTPREVSFHANSPDRKKHGRHRTYFGDAKSMTILAPQAHHKDGAEKSNRKDNQ